MLTVLKMLAIDLWPWDGVWHWWNWLSVGLLAVSAVWLAASLLAGKGKAPGPTTP